MYQCCPMQTSGGNGLRGPPLPIVILPIIYQIVRYNPDLKIARHVRKLLKTDGPASVAENAHHILQYVLSRVPSDVIYWFASKVLNLSPDVATETTGFLKSRTQLEDLLMGDSLHVGEIEGQNSGGAALVLVPSDVVRRLERLEVEYRLLQEQHGESLRLLALRTDDMEVPRGLAPPAPSWSGIVHDEASTELVKAESSPLDRDSPRTSTSSLETQALLQEIGLRLGRVVLEWAGDTMRQTVLSVAQAKSTSDSRVGAAGRDLIGRLASVMIA